MKLKHILVVLVFTLCSSCIVKSLNPFYIEKAIVSLDDFKGEWIDQNKGKWLIKNFNYTKETLDSSKIEKKKDPRIWINTYKVEYSIDDREFSLLAMPFKVNNKIFIDFTPFEYEIIDLNDIKGFHQIDTHTIAKIDFNEDDSINLKWLSEKRILELFAEEKLKIKHEKVGALNNNVVLTAKSEELYNFMKKYLASNDPEIWENDVEYTLKGINAQP